jgi:5-methylcytosine-specific restriction endonuclease McrA
MDEAARERRREYDRNRRSTPEFKAREAERRRQRYQANREDAKAAAKAAYYADPEKARARVREYYARPEVRAWRSEYCRKRNADPEVKARYAVWETCNGICHICQRPADPTDWHLDHIIPLSRGGDHTYANVAVSHPMCNMRKHAHDPRAA